MKPRDPRLAAPDRGVERKTEHLIGDTGPALGCYVGPAKQRNSKRARDSKQGQLRGQGDPGKTKRAKKIKIPFNPDCFYNVGIPVDSQTVPAVPGSGSLLASFSSPDPPNYPFKDYDGRCRWDHHDFKGSAVGFPVRYDTRLRKFHVIGAFCSYNCALAFALVMGDSMTRRHCRWWMKMMLKRLGVKERVTEAPPCYMLKAYKGPLSIDEFRSSHCQVVHIVGTNYPGILPVAWQLTTVDKRKEVTEFAIPGQQTRGKQASGVLIKSGQSHTTADLTNREFTSREDRIKNAMKRFGASR